MKKLLYKDELYFYKIVDDSYGFADYCYYLRVYVLRTSFWKFLSKYKMIGEYFYLDSRNNKGELLKKSLTKIIEESDYIANQMITPPLIINCSKEITELYKEINNHEKTTI